MRKPWAGLKFFSPKSTATSTNVSSESASTPPAGSANITTPTGIEWIDNDGLLRDEGVLFGIGRSNTKEKEEAIRNGFEKAKAAFAVQIAAGKEELAQNETERSQHQNKITEIKTKVIELKANVPKEQHRLLPMFTQVVAYSLIAYFNYYLIAFWLQPVFGSGSLITLGLYSFGMLSVYLGKALVYNADEVVQQGDGSGTKREKWKIWLEEIGVPFIAAAFITVIAFRDYSVEWSIAAFFLFFFLFSFSGKGLINSLYRTHKEFKLVQANWRAKRVANIAARKLEHEAKSVEQIVQTLVSNREQKRLQLLQPETSLKELDAQLAYKLNIFYSEYYLASGAQEQMTEKQKATFN